VAAGPPKPAGMRLMFTLYLLLIVSGIAFYAVIGLTHH
jgi:hypothetical protein